VGLAILATFLCLTNLNKVTEFEWERCVLARCCARASRACHD
jgi:hypothetical protein